MLSMLCILHLAFSCAFDLRKASKEHWQVSDRMTEDSAELKKTKKWVEEESKLKKIKLALNEVD